MRFHNINGNPLVTKPCGSAWHLDSTTGKQQNDSRSTFFHSNDLIAEIAAGVNYESGVCSV